MYFSNQRLMGKRCVSVILALLITIILAGCLNPTLASSELDAEAKHFVPDPGKASVYLFRKSDLNVNTVGAPVMFNGRLAGATGPDTYFLWQVNSGSHTINAQNAGHAAELTIEAISGKLYFVELRMGPFAGLYLEEVAIDVGKRAVQKCRRIQHENPL